SKSPRTQQAEPITAASGFSQPARLQLKDLWEPFPACPQAVESFSSEPYAAECAPSPLSAQVTAGLAQASPTRSTAPVEVVAAGRIGERLLPARQGSSRAEVQRQCEQAIHEAATERCRAFSHLALPIVLRAQELR